MFEQLGEGVFRRRYESLDINVGVVVGDDGVLVVDTRCSHTEGNEIVEDLRHLTALPVRWVINTHWHWDHVFGNAVFAGTEIWGHELTQMTLEQRGEEMKAGGRDWLGPERHAEIDAVEIVPPDRVFSDAVSLEVGRSVELTYHGFAHTDADIVVRVPSSGVAFFGDMIEQGGPPYFGDSYPIAWPLTLRLASSQLPPTIVPGHGDVVDEPFVRGQHEELVAVAETATAFVKGEVDLEAAAAAGPYPVDVMTEALLRAQTVA